MAGLLSATFICFNPSLEIQDAWDPDSCEERCVEVSILLLRFNFDLKTAMKMAAKMAFQSFS